MERSVVPTALEEKIFEIAQSIQAHEHTRGDPTSLHVHIENIVQNAIEQMDLMELKPSYIESSISQKVYSYVIIA